MTKIELKISEHNRIVKAQTKLSFMGLQPYAKGVLRVAPKGYAFTISHQLVQR